MAAERIDRGPTPRPGDAGPGDRRGPSPAERAAPARGRRRQRIPSARELANLLRHGRLELPANYRPGMYLDLTV